MLNNFDSSQIQNMMLTHDVEQRSFQTRTSRRRGGIKVRK